MGNQYEDTSRQYWENWTKNIEIYHLKRIFLNCRRQLTWRWWLKSRQAGRNQKPLKCLHLIQRWCILRALQVVLWCSIVRVVYDIMMIFWGTGQSIQEKTFLMNDNLFILPLKNKFPIRIYIEKILKMNCFVNWCLKTWKLTVFNI